MEKEKIDQLLPGMRNRSENRFQCGRRKNGVRNIFQTGLSRSTMYGTRSMIISASPMRLNFNGLSGSAKD